MTTDDKLYKMWNFAALYSAGPKIRMKILDEKRKQNMRKVIFRGSAKTVGTDYAEAHLYRPDVEDEVLNADAWQATVDNAEMYGWSLTAEECPDDDEDGDWYDNYCHGDELDGWWEDYNPEVHDELRCGGGSFEEDFAWQARFHS